MCSRKLETWGNRELVKVVGKKGGMRDLSFIKRSRKSRLPMRDLGGGLSFSKRIVENGI